MYACPIFQKSLKHQYLDCNQMAYNWVQQLQTSEKFWAGLSNDC